LKPAGNLAPTGECSAHRVTNGDRVPGTWFSPWTEFNAFLGAARGLARYGTGKAAIASFDPNAVARKFLGDFIPGLTYQLGSWYRQQRLISRTHVLVGNIQ